MRRAFELERWMDFLQNPFFILNANPQDNGRRIMDLAAERILFQDPVKVNKAAETLTKPLPRLSAEIAWLPNHIPKKR